MRLQAFKAKFVTALEYHCSWIIDGVVINFFHQRTLFKRHLFVNIHLVYLTIADGTLVDIQQVGNFVQITLIHLY
jgi:hypothetical protein